MTYDISTFSADAQRRIAMTVRVRATDSIRKVPGAGQIRSRDGSQVQVMHNGLVVEKDCYYGSWMTAIISILRGHHEPQEELAFDRLVQLLKNVPGPLTMVELGAYWGYYSLWLKTEIPSARTVLVEPDPRNLAVGARNFDLNQLEARFVHAAVGTHHATTVELRCESDGIVRSVRAVTLDGLMEDEGLARVDLILCDVQGAEIDMLRGAARAIQDRHVRFMVISTHWFPTRPALHQHCAALVTELGGHIIAEHSITESCSVDGLIVASFDPRDRDLTIDLPVVRARESAIGELEWFLAGRAGWRGVVRGLIDMLPPGILEKLRSSRLVSLLRARLMSSRT